MTAEPKAPLAPAIILSHDEFDDTGTGEILVHERIKVLTPDGLDAGTVALPRRFDDDDPSREEVFARVIHADGVIVPFTGKPQKGKTSENIDLQRSIIVLPSVEVGSILEFICHYKGYGVFVEKSWSYFAPFWRVQRTYFVRSARFAMKVSGSDAQDRIQWDPLLPPGVQPVREKKDRITLDVSDVPAIVNEPFMPPLDAVVYRVHFYYYKGTAKEFWTGTGSVASRGWEFWDTPTTTLKSAVAQLAHPGDSESQKLRRIYDAVNGLQNTDTLRWHSAKEDKKNGVREIKTIDDVWLGRRGSSMLLTMLFIAMARAAGFDAYPMVVVSRDTARFDERLLDWNQFDSAIALVQYAGAQHAFDPGTPMCPFGLLAPWHAQAQGFGITNKAMSLLSTPAMPASASRRERIAGLKLAADGSAEGTIRIVWIGGSAIRLRLLALASDRQEIAKQLETSLQDDLPHDLHVTFTALDGLDSPDLPLVANFSVSGKLATLTAKRMFLPTQLFASHDPNPFAAGKRTQPVSFLTTHRDHDQVNIQLPAGLQVETMPQSQTLQLDQRMDYMSQLQMGHLKGAPADAGQMLVLQRVYELNLLDIPLSDYAELRSYFGSMTAGDQAQIVLTRPTGAAATR